MKRLSTIFFLFLLGLTAAAQEEVPGRTEEKLESLADLTETNPEDDDFLQQLDYARRNPLNINTATAEDLQVFRVLTGLQVQQLIKYRQLFGPLLSVYELQAIPSWDIPTIRRILPYITVTEPLTLRSFGRRFLTGEHIVLLRNSRVLEKARGYDTSLTSYYPGSPDHLLFRYRYQNSNLLQYGVTAEKDAGEQFFNGAQTKGFDFYSAHFFARQLGVVKALALGDFTVNMGQGLIQWQALAFKKNPDVLGTKRQAAVLRPYSAAGEFYFSRGAGVTLQFKRVEATAFGSLKKISGNVIADTSSAEDFFSSFLTSGLHRTASEIQDRYSVEQTSFGGNISYQTPSFKLSFNTVHYRFSKALQKQDEPYNRFAISGKDWSNYSADYGFTYRNLHVYGEAAVDKEGRMAFLNGTLLSVDPKVDIATVYRNIDKGYQALYGNAFTESVSPSNEKGFYAGVRVRPLPRWQVDAYADFYRFPWLKFRVDAPSEGKDYFVQLTFQPKKGAEFYTRYRHEAKQTNESGVTTPLNFLVYKPRQNWRLNAEYPVSRTVTLRGRVERMWFDKDGKGAETGILTYIQGNFKPSMVLSVNARLQYFNTDGYNSRIYAYESDVLYSFSIPAFYDTGLRYYVNLNYDIGKHFTVWLRWAQTVYNDKEVIGSGLDEIKGNKRSEAKVQLRYIF